MKLTEVMSQLKFLMSLGKDGSWNTKPKSGAPEQPDGKYSKPLAKQAHPGGAGPVGFGAKGGGVVGLPVKPEKWMSAGGVVVASKDDYSRIYIRLPSNNYGPWSFPKGQIDKGETPPKAALREVEEEIGVKAELVSGGYLGTGEGGFSITHYYLMAARHDSHKTDSETQEVKIVTWEEALHTFAKAGNMRDLRITSRALDMVESMRKKGKIP